MFQHFFNKVRPPRVPKVHIAIGTLKLSEMVCWLDRRCLLDPMPYVQRHRRGDWGDVDDEQHSSNQDALEHAGDLYSSYHVTPSLTLVVISNEDRSETIVQLQEERSLF